MLSETLKNAKNKMTICKMCLNCNGEACRGLIPGPGGKGSGSTFVNNFKALRKIQLNMKVIRNDFDVDCKFDYFGTSFQAPIMIAPMASVQGHFGCDILEKDFVCDLGLGAKEANILSFYGDGKDPDFFGASTNILSQYQYGVPTIKPWSMSLVKEKIDSVLPYCKYGIAMDVDAAGLVFLKKTSTPIEFKNVDDLKQVKKWINGPFIIKGIMTVEDAKSAIDAGADAIIVSNHGGRVMDDGVASIDVLKEIVQFINGRIKVFTDGGYRSGFDVFKALALGADAVLIGRPFAHQAIGGSQKAVTDYANKLCEELRDAMRLTGCKTLNDIHEKNIKL